MSSIPDALKQDLLQLMRRSKREKFQPYLSHQELTPSEINVILCIHMADARGVNPIQPRNVAAWLHLTPSALSQTLKALEEKHFIERHRTSGDSRVVSLSLTPKAAGFAEESTQVRDQFLDELIAYIGEEDARHLINTFDKVLDFFSEQADGGAIQRGGCQMDHPPCGHDFHVGMMEAEIEKSTETADSITSLRSDAIADMKKVEPCE